MYTTLQKLIFTIMFIVVVSISAVCANIEAYFMYATYNSSKTPYIETYMSFIGNSLVFVENSDGKYSAKVEISVLIYKDDSVIIADKYNLSSPEITDVAGLKPNFIDVQRYAITSGIYNLYLIVKDKNAELNTSEFNDIIQIDFKNNEISIGGIEYLENFKKTDKEAVSTKNGYELIPYVSNFFPQNIEKLNFYFEIYGTDKILNDAFLLKVYLEGYENKEIKIGKNKKLTPSATIPYIGEFNIKDLESGNYNLVIELLNKDNQIVKKEKFFIQRSNNNINAVAPITFDENTDVPSLFSGNMENRDSLIEYVNCLRPIATPTEQRFIDHEAITSNLKVLQNFFAEFWYSRDSQTPNEIWKQYWEQILYVNRAFGNKARKGYNTDMGIVYLKYGAPNEVYDSKHESSAYPYQIWTYWKTKTESNRKFVFYNQNFAGRDYELLHSNAKGEIVTKNWERYLQKRNNDLYNFDSLNSDGTDNGRQWGSRALEEFGK